ncbi:MAG: protein translocase subunit SecF [candidate division Zixibacteria bacterium]|nr:protein translocase subunit SecF [candidate division Zixibacteria bacterium]
MFRLIGDTKIDFIGQRKVSFIVSAILSAIGIFAFVMILLGKAEMGIDFAGGVMVQGHFESPVSIESVRAAVETEFSDASVTQVADNENKTFIIKTKRPESDAAGSEKLEALVGALEKKFPGNAFIRDSEHIIGPSVGESLRKDAVKAILISLVGILAYIAFRFDLRSGVAATIATFHDVLAIIGIFYIFGLEFDLLIVTALLTIAGYSLTDTVVVFDRIRENLRKYRTKGEFVNSVNLSINETLSRTLNTSMTLLIVVLILYAFGGVVLKNFSLALIIGVLIGTYSSIFVASPILVEWEARSPKRFK